MMYYVITLVVLGYKEDCEVLAVTKTLARAKRYAIDALAGFMEVDGEDGLTRNELREAVVETQVSDTKWAIEFPEVVVVYINQVKEV